MSIQEYNATISTCVENIISHWIQKGSHITYVDLNYQNDDILKSIHRMNFATVVSRKTKSVNHYNEAYIIAAENLYVFKNEFKHLIKEKDWTPSVYFIIILNDKTPNAITDLFDILIHYHVFNVAVITGTSGIQIFTYDPFENNSCGKKYFNIKSFNTCSNTSIAKLYSTNIDGRLKGCIFNFATSHRAPYSIKPNIKKFPEHLMGMEQFVLNILGEKEGFKINFTALYDPDIYPVVKDDMSATGALSLIQKGDVDIVFGGMLLLRERAVAFSYFYEHLAYTDELVMLVKTAGPVASWKNIYLEFSYLVWFLLFLTFLIFFVIFIIVLQIKDKCHLMLIMWGLLFQHGYRKGFNFKMEYFIFQWVLFAFLINIYYQSNLMGLTTHFSYNYQVSDEKDIMDYNMEPCISNNIKGLINATIGNDYDVEMDEDCDKTMASMQTVSENYKKYTLVLHSLFNYNRFKYTDDYGNSLLYSFKIPTNKIIYAVYFYKGFPKINTLRYNVLRIRESGLLDKHLRDLFYEEAKKYKFRNEGFQVQFILPWYILIVGVFLSGITLIIELIVDFFQRKRRYREIYLP